MLVMEIVIPTEDQQIARAIYEIEAVLIQRATTTQQAVLILAGVFRAMIAKEDSEHALKYFNDLMPGLYEYKEK